ncbi:recombinase XerD [Leptospira selangorensis]|uniref:Recombinase XerD n=1 Tax=Leptospira selangorensis TaxID=2484982 RepID=A0A5F2BY06_9LEPT|nr:tyrosine-type recombinase/integrase [Leptospira selangorensis]TGM14213.1 recombinase XerD [Leptospira selangorensis]TGM16896.1 recombinase XerD [Leptospira selangorensis]
MGALKEKMILDMRLRGYSENTIDLYTDCLTRLAKEYMISPLKLKPNQVYDFFIKMKENKASAAYLRIFYSAIKLFYKIENKAYMTKAISLPKKVRKIPIIMNKSEVKAFLSECRSLQERTIFSLLYSSGIRGSELINLRIEDIDFERKTIYILKSKTRKQRYTILSDQAANLLKNYILTYQPKELLFFGFKNKNSHISMRCLQATFQRIAKRAGIKKKVQVHTFRHSFATHLMETGNNLVYIQKLLGHSFFSSTLIYLHTDSSTFLKTISPLESIDLKHFGSFGKKTQGSFDFSM